MTRLLVSLAAMFVVWALDSVEARAQAWQAEVNEYGLATATVTTQAFYREHAVPVAVRFQCSPGADGSLSIMLIIRDASLVPSFPLDYFEGPDAPANERELLRVEVGGATVSFSFDLPTSGWYLDEAFIIAHAAPAEGDSPVRRIADAIEQGATSLAIGVRSPDDPNEALFAPTPLAGASTVLARTTAACR